MVSKVSHVYMYDTRLTEAYSARMRIEAEKRREETTFRWPSLSAVK